MDRLYTPEEADRLVCGECGKSYDHLHWMNEEKCKHCGKFLDNPPYVMLPEEFTEKARLQND